MTIEDNPNYDKAMQQVDKSDLLTRAELLAAKHLSQVMRRDFEIERLNVQAKRLREDADAWEGRCAEMEAELRSLHVRIETIAERNMRIHQAFEDVGLGRIIRRANAIGAGQRDPDIEMWLGGDGENKYSERISVRSLRELVKAIYSTVED